MTLPEFFVGFNSLNESQKHDKLVQMKSDYTHSETTEYIHDSNFGYDVGEALVEIDNLPVDTELTPPAPRIITGSYKLGLSKYYILYGRKIAGGTFYCWIYDSESDVYDVVSSGIGAYINWAWDGFPSNGDCR